MDTVEVQVQANGEQSCFFVSFLNLAPFGASVVVKLACVIANMHINVGDS